MTIPDKRQTGRTHRMMARATELEARGVIVFVLVNNQRDMYRLKDQLPKESRISINLLDTADVNMFTMQMRRCHPNHVVLIDHEAIRIRYYRMLEEYFCYNEVTRSVGNRRISVTPELAEQVNLEINQVLERHGLLQKDEEQDGQDADQGSDTQACKSE